MKPYWTDKVTAVAAFLGFVAAVAGLVLSAVSLSVSRDAQHRAQRALDMQVTISKKTADQSARASNALLSLQIGPTKTPKGGTTIPLLFKNAGGGAAANITFGIEFVPTSAQIPPCPPPPNPLAMFAGKPIGKALGVGDTLLGKVSIGPLIYISKAIVFVNWTNYAGDKRDVASCYDPLSERSDGGLLIRGLPSKLFRASHATLRPQVAGHG